MIQEVAMSSIVVDLSAILIALITLVTVLVLSLTTYARPSRVTVIWGVAFGVGMLATYLWVGAHRIELPALQGLASGIMLCFEPLMWLGLRAFRNRRLNWWPLLVFAGVVPVLLAFTADTAAFPMVFRVTFLSGAVFAALIVYELIRLRPVARDITVPLMLASCAFIIIALVSFIGGLFGTTPADGVTQLASIRNLNGVGTLLSSVCAAVTVILLVRVESGGAGESVDASVRFSRKLDRAKAQRDSNWSLLDIRLDDPADLRQAWTGSTYSRIISTFHERVDESLPAAADAHRVGDARVLVLTPASEGAVIHQLRTLLGSISAVEEDGPLASLRLSASVGWADVEKNGYGYERLLAQAEVGAERAREDGGDCWKRMGV